MRSFLLLCFACALTLRAQVATSYPEIPRIDVHAHVGSKFERMQSFMEMRDEVKAKIKADLALWINLGDRTEEPNNWPEAERRFQGRFVPSTAANC